MKIRLLGAHNLETRDTRHTCFMIDGVLGVDAGSLASALSAAELAEIRAILLTHHHFDHIRDIPTLGLANRDAPTSVAVFSQPQTLRGVHEHLIDGDVYPDLTQPLDGAAPRFDFQPLEPWKPLRVLGYRVKPIPVPHPVPSVGYVVTSDSGDCAAFSGDTGGELLPFFQEQPAPRVLFVESTFPNRLESLAKMTGHLTPRLLRGQLLEALRRGLKPPAIVVVHRGLGAEEELAEELGEVGSELQIDLTLGHEDMVYAAAGEGSGQAIVEPVVETQAWRRPSS